MLCSRTVRRFDIPGEPGEWMEMRLLSQVQIKEERNRANDEVAGLPEEERAREAGSLMLTRVLRRCLVAWSYREADGSPVPLTEENLDDLDSKTQLWAFYLAIGQEPEEESEKD